MTTAINSPTARDLSRKSIIELAQITYENALAAQAAADATGDAAGAAQTAVTAAATASQAAAAAEQAEGNAFAAQQSAQALAVAARESAAAAQQSENFAVSAKNQAVTASNTATTKATNAATSAGQAAVSATNAAASAAEAEAAADRAEAAAGQGGGGAAWQEVTPVTFDDVDIAYTFDIPQTGSVLACILAADNGDVVTCTPVFAIPAFAYSDLSFSFDVGETITAYIFGGSLVGRITTGMLGDLSMYRVRMFVQRVV